MRTSFAPDDPDESGSVITPKKTNLSRIAIEKSAQGRIQSNEERPSYSKESLAELRDSMPTTPKDLDSDPMDEAERSLLEMEDSSPLDTSAQPSAEPSSVIPSTAEILEKKVRNTRLGSLCSVSKNLPWAPTNTC
jgi:hypothetical protein